MKIWHFESKNVFYYKVYPIMIFEGLSIDVKIEKRIFFIRVDPLITFEKKLMLFFLNTLYLGFKGYLLENFEKFYNVKSF